MSVTLKLDMGVGFGDVEITADSPEELVNQMNSLSNFGKEPSKNIEEVILAKLAELIGSLKPDVVNNSTKDIDVLASAYQRIMSV